MQITTERLDDLPFLSWYIKQSRLVEQIDQHFPVHGLWQGPSFGQTLHGFLLFILSECRHSLYQVEEWASTRVETLKWLLECPTFEAKHLSDDRLGLVLEYFSGAPYEAFQSAHNRELIKVYQLQDHRIARLDSTRAQSFSRANELLAKGHKQVNKRADLVSVKTMLVSLDPLALPISTLVVRGNRVDDQLYIPVIEQAWKAGINTKGMLFVGDTKLGNQANWSFISQSGNYYLSPLSLKQFGQNDLDEALDWVESTQQNLYPFYGHQYDEGQVPQAISASAHYVELPAELKSDPNTGLTWPHRLLAIQNEDMRQKQLLNLEQRCEQAIIQIKQRFIPKRGRKRIRTLQQAQDQVDSIIKKYKVDSFIQVSIMEPERTTAPYQVQCALQEQAYKQAQKRAGWSVYATNAPEDIFSIHQLLRIYRQQYRIEQQFHKLLNKCTALEPIFLQKPNRIEALIRILVIALQFVALIQYKVRSNLAQQDDRFMTNLIPGNPGRKVYRPTTTLILKAFKPIDLVMIHSPTEGISCHITDLSQVQTQSLYLAGIPPDVYLHPSCQRTD